MSRQVPTKAQSFLDAEIIEIGNRGGGVRRVTGRNLRELSHDAAVAIADRFGGTRIADLIEELTRATCITNGGREIADNRTRLAAVTLAAAYVAGRPVERSESVNLTVETETQNDIQQRIDRSPALRKSLAALLAKSQSQTNV